MDTAIRRQGQEFTGTDEFFGDAHHYTGYKQLNESVPSPDTPL
jgi:hypothetical protein